MFRYYKGYVSLLSIIFVCKSELVCGRHEGIFSAVKSIDHKSIIVVFRAIRTSLSNVVVPQTSHCHVNRVNINSNFTWKERSKLIQMAYAKNSLYA